jgi:hypothetical protein
MAFKDLAVEARKAAPKNRIGETTITALRNSGEKTSTGTILDDTNYHEYRGTAFTGKKQVLDERHCNIIKNVVNDAQSEGRHVPATWETCRHHKTKGDRDFCTEYLSWCSKDKCSRARR